MKRILYYIVPLLAMLSCSEQMEQDIMAEGKLSTTISVVLPQIPDAYPQLGTRAMGMNPQMENLYLAVFDDNGYLLEYVKAADGSQMATENEKIYTYQVSLTPTDFPTYIHFIGNAPSTLSFGTEVEAVGKLFTEGGSEAYWQKISFPQGIKKNADGTLHTSVTNALKDVRLVRNFAWIKLSNSAENFEVTSYCVINTRTKGTVAPYNTSQSQFADFTHQQTYSDLIDEGYEGFIPAEAGLNQFNPDSTTWFTTQGKAEDEYAYFVYEREKPTSNPTFILVKGNYTPEGSTTKLTNRYYKVDLRQGNGDYFPILRNFRYNIDISSVKHEGHATAQAAVEGAGSGDVSTSIETEDFTNISNNIARIFVSYTDTVLVNQMTDLKLRYKFMVFETEDEEGKTTPEQILNGDANITIELGASVGGKVIQSWTKDTKDEKDGWRTITISTTELADIRKSEEIIIKGKVTIGEGEHAKTYQLQRKVTLTLRPKYDMQLVCDPAAIQKKLGEPFDLLLKVPGGLGSSMFPLEFQIEAENQSITPNLGDDLPVVTGKSIIASKNEKTAIGFIKHIEWSDYDALPNDGGYKTIRCHFKSNKAESATAIYAQNKYFNQKSTNLENYTPSTFKNLTLTPDNPWLSADSEVTFSFTMDNIPSQGYITVALDNLTKADDEDRLTYIGIDTEGNACYRFNPQNLNETLRLKVDEAGKTIAVKLSAYHFTDNSTSLDPKDNGTFRNLKLTPKNAMLVEETEVDFTFTMSDKPMSVIVTLGNLKPATGESRLTPIEGQSGVYRFTPGDKLTETLKLAVVNSYSAVNVQLSADNFSNSSVSLNPKKGTFSNLKLTPKNAMLVEETEVDFTFTMSDKPMSVIVTLGNLKPATGESRLTPIEGQSGVYRFTPGDKTETLKLAVVNSYSTVNVQLSADNFNNSSVELEPTFVIRANTIDVGTAQKNNRTFTIYSSNSTDRNNIIATFTPRKNTSTNPDNIEMSKEEYQTVMNNNGKIYIRYDRSYATADLQTLLNGRTVTLDW